LALAGFTYGIKVEAVGQIAERLHRRVPVWEVLQGVILYKYTGTEINQNINF
jgi:hypothetical protein